MNSEQMEHRILGIIRETAKRHGVRVIVRVGELSVSESKTAVTVSYKFTRHHRWLPLLLGAVAMGSGYMLMSVVEAGVTDTELGCPWPALPMVAAMLLHGYIRSKPEMTPAMWEQILWEELIRNGFVSFRDSTGVTQVHNVQ